NASVGVGPTSAFVARCPIVTAETGPVGPAAARKRFSQPSRTVLSSGAPNSMKSCASKCERVPLGLPHAWIAARRPDWKSGWSGASAGWNPKKPSRSTTLAPLQDRKSTRLNSSHVKISYAVFCLKKKKKKKKQEIAQTYRLRRNDV